MGGKSLQPEPARGEHLPFTQREQTREPVQLSRVPEHRLEVRKALVLLGREIAGVG